MIFGGELKPPPPHAIKERIVWRSAEGMGKEQSHLGTRAQAAVGTPPGWTDGCAVSSPPGKRGEPLTLQSGEMTQ